MMRSGRFSKVGLVAAALLLAACAGTTAEPAAQASAATLQAKGEARGEARGPAPVSRPIAGDSAVVYNLAWVEPGSLLRSGAPIVNGDHLATTDPADQGTIDAAYAMLRAKYHVGAVVNLRDEGAEDAAAARAQGMTYLHLPIVDGAAPTGEQVKRFFGFVDAERAKGEVVLFHCAGGIGRTGFMAAVQRLRDGWSQEAAAQEMFGMGLTYAQAAEHLPALARFASQAGLPTWFPGDWATSRRSPQDYAAIAETLVR